MSKERAAALLGPPRDFASKGREKSPFEIGGKPDVVVASQKAIIDKVFWEIGTTVIFLVAVTVIPKYRFFLCVKMQGCCNGHQWWRHKYR